MKSIFKLTFLMFFILLRTIAQIQEKYGKPGQW